MKSDEYNLFKKIGLKIKIIISNTKKTKIICSGLFSNIIKKYFMRELNFFNNKKYVMKIDKNNKSINEYYYKTYGNSLIFSTWIPPIPSKVFSRMLISRILSNFGFIKYEQLTISIIEDCPNHCIHCALPNKNNHSYLDINNLKKIISDAINIGFTSIILDGGETLLYDKLEEIISFISPSKAIVSLFTSGFSLNKEKAISLKKSGLYSINISIDSSFESKHDFIRGRKGSYNEVINAIKFSRDVGLLVNMYCVLSPFNIMELENIYSLAMELDVNELSFYEIVPTGRWDSKKILTENQKNIYFNFIKSKKNSKGPKIFSGPDIIKNFGCMAGNKWIHITPEGNVQPCACIPISYGNIKEKSLKKIIKSININKYKNNFDCLMRLKK